MALPLLAVVAIGAGVGAAGQAPQLLESIYQAKSLREQASFAREVAEINAETLRREAEARRIARTTQENAERDVARRRLAAMEAGYAKAGVLLEGTPSLLVETQAGMEERATLQRSQDALHGRNVLRTQGRNLKIEARNVSNALRTQAKMTMFRGIFGMAKGTIQGAAGGFAGTPAGASFLSGGEAGAAGGGFSMQNAMRGFNVAGGLMGGGS